MNIKNWKDGPYEFMLDVIDSKIIVTGILEGGIIHKHGLYLFEISDHIGWYYMGILLIGGVKVGDELIEINGMRLEASRFKESLKRLEDAMEDNTSVRFDSDVDLEVQNALKL